MVYSDLLHAVPHQLRTLFRKYENIRKKLINIEWSTKFNRICLKENILPKYTKLRHHDPAVASTERTLKYRRYLIEREISCNDKKESEMEKAKESCIRDIREFNCNMDLKNSIFDALEVILRNTDNAVKSKTLKKINSLYHGCEIKVKDKSICIKDDRDSFVNLSSYALSKEEKEFLNLGLNTHIEPKYDKMHKKVEIEVMYRELLQLESQNKILVNQELADQLRAEGTKHRNVKHYNLLTPSLRNAAKNLKSNNNIVIKKADKSAIYVILDKDEYIEKINSILSDQSKFKRISRNPTEKLKQKANKLIETLNAGQDSLKLPKIIGDFRPGYVYGNIKTHKENNPLRPIISQIPTPTYNLAKQVNHIISPYIPSQYSLKSSNDFIDLLQEHENEGIIASLDVESLFTNVPIDPTIEIILEHVYNHPNIPPPKIPKVILKQFLELCTKEAPFKCPQGKLYLQIEGVAMGSPLGPTFANYYMGNLENHIFENSDRKPHIYGRYMDDIFVQVKDEEELIGLKNLFQENSTLNFTYELNVNSKLPFLDVLVDSSFQNFRTSVYHKPTDQGNCLNGESECTERYKTSVITNYMNRAYKLSNSWEEFHLEILQIKQRLVNNNYTNTIVDKYVKKFLDKKLTQEPQIHKKEIIPIYYENQSHANCKIDERIIKNIVYSNTKSKLENKKLELRIYYKNTKTCNLVMKNNLTPPPSLLDESNVIYKFSCPLSHRQATEYVGFTQTTLSQRLVAHRQNGSIHNHFKEFHNSKPSREHLTENTKIIAKARDRTRLAIKEALIILEEKPIINKQYDNFSNVLKLHQLKNNTQKQDTLKTQGETAENLCLSPLTPSEPIPNLNHSPPTLHSDSLLMVNNKKNEMLAENIPYLGKSLNSNIDNTHHTIPDMEVVLRKFGINPDSLTYIWLDEDLQEETSQNSLSISQRIHTLKRQCKNSNTNQSNQE